jgi:hypothetical protein
LWQALGLLAELMPVELTSRERSELTTTQRLAVAPKVLPRRADPAVAALQEFRASRA